MISFEEARNNVGNKVVYRSLAMRSGLDPSRAEEGVITGVGVTYVFVRYGTSTTSAATDPTDLDLVSRGGNNYRSKQ